MQYEKYGVIMIFHNLLSDGVFLKGNNTNTCCNFIFKNTQYGKSLEIIVTDSLIRETWYASRDHTTSTDFEEYQQMVKNIQIL